MTLTLAYPTCPSLKLQFLGYTHAFGDKDSSVAAANNILASKQERRGEIGGHYLKKPETLDNGWVRITFDTARLYHEIIPRLT